MTTRQTAFQLFRNGDFERAEDAARAGLQSGEDPALRHLLGALLCRRESLEEGAAELGRALEQMPGQAALRADYVRALIRLGRGSEALRHAPRPDPGPALFDLWRLRAEAAAAAGEPAEQMEALHEADLALIAAELQNRPDDPELLLYKGRLLAALARDGEAEPVFRRLIAADPANGDAVRELALLLERANRLDEVRALLDAAIAAGAEPGRFAMIEALLAWRSGDPNTTLEWLGKSGEEAGSPRAKELEAKAEDALGNSAAAFAAAEAQNRAAPDYEAWRQRSALYRSRLRDAAEKITPDWVRGWTPVDGPSEPAPVFLVGFPRSGTTLLDTLLMGHPDIAVVEEVPALGLVAEEVGTMDRLAELDAATADRLRRTYSDAIRRSLPPGSAASIVDKLPLNMIHAPLIHRLFPGAKIVFAQRHPCDCVLSAFFQRFALNPAMACFLDIADAADLYDAAMEIWTRSRAALPLDVHVIGYEAMVDEPEEELRKLVAFLGLDWREELLDHRSTADARGAIGTPSYQQVTQPISDRAVMRWRRYEEQLRPVLPVLLPWAERLGYAA